MIWPCFFCGTVFDCPQSPYRDNDILDDILYFSYCPFSCVLLVTLANLQKSWFEVHLRSSPSAFRGSSADQPTTSLLACNTVLTRPNKVETAVQGCNSWLSVSTLSCRCPVKHSTQYQPCIIVFSVGVLA